MSIIQPFDHAGVKLNDSRLKLQFDEVRDFYLRLPTNDWQLRADDRGQA